MTPGSPHPAPVDEAALPAGHKVFEYRIEKPLGGGGFGITYLARDSNLDLPVAIKEYFPGELTFRAADHSVRVRGPGGERQFHWGLERFLDEARALASFRHPNIARVLRYFRDNGTAYIVMEYESGDPLKRWLARQPALGLATLLKVVYPLLDGLEAVHKRDFLHRDIKPDNIYIRADGSPVLLDFGAARRTTGGYDLTNIVSPGFAPFEQYHSKGKQGPWSDIYSLGAVMYWMATGEKPVESTARVQGDSLPAALAIGDAAVFGAGLLRAIDWALCPDENRRPQSVTELRTALVAAERAATGAPAQGAAPPSDTRPGPDSNIRAFAGSTQVPGSSTDHVRRNVLGTVMFLNLVAYSRHPAAQQVVLKQRFNELITKALKGVPQASHIVIDTVDGAATCFLGDPEEALQSALLMRSLLMQKYGQMLSLRIGVHLGTIRIVFDVNQRVNVVGDGINVAQRIMDFAQPNQIVVSRAYYDVISRITDNAAALFSPMGPHLDKHLRSHDLYAVMEPQARPLPVAPAHNSAFAHTASFATLSSLTPEMLADIESELAHSIGPLAKVLMKKALPRCVGAQGLRELLAVSIPDPGAREAFIRPKSQKTQPVGMPASVSGSWPDPSRRPRPELSHPVSRPHSGSISGHSVPVSSPWFTAAQLTQLERALSQVIGPLAKMLVKKQVARHTSLEALRQALASEIDHVAERTKFLAATQKLS